MQFAYPLFFFPVAWYLGAKLHGIFSFVSLGVVGLTVYSIPYVLDKKILFHYGSLAAREFIDISVQEHMVMFAAWGAVCFSLLIALLAKRRQSITPLSSVFRAPTKLATERFLPSTATVLSAIGILYLVYLGGLFFFAAPREEQIVSPFTLLWKWFSVFGLTACVIQRRWGLFSVCFFVLLLTFLRGDRTMIVIGSLIVVTTYFYGARYLSWSVCLKVLLTALLIFVVIFFGKPIYLAVKTGEIEYLSRLLDPAYLTLLAFNFEPFLTANHLDHVMKNSIWLPSNEFGLSILGNLLFVPSQFGVETNLYNLTVTRSISVELNYGIAGSYWAHAWSAGGYFAVVTFGCIYIAVLIVCDSVFKRSSGVLRVAAGVLGGTVAVYAHRNGLDNFLSFPRQIIVVAVILCAANYCVVLFRSILPSKRERAPPKTESYLHASTWTRSE